MKSRFLHLASSLMTLAVVDAFEASLNVTPTLRASLPLLTPLDLAVLTDLRDDLPVSKALTDLADVSDT